ncbi:hypothetical protein V865_001232 [Kwoniella europaea PYCC6329]|uniref:Uncharacterized protein n=1 Tax=Kwoniella europaea PYCC6329 TaxID=1423913 RepID=A0AAX4K9W2_9TREE
MFNKSIVSLLGIVFYVGVDPVIAGQRYDNAIGTIYYDLNDACKVSGADATGDMSNMKTGNNACGYAVGNLGASRVVAISQSIFSNDLCGSEITVYKNGQPVQFSEGPLFVGDICPGGECTGNHIDLGAKAADEINGGSGCKNPSGFSFEVGDQKIGPLYSSVAGASLEAWKASGGGTNNQQNTPSNSASAPGSGVSSSSSAAAAPPPSTSSDPIPPSPSSSSQAQANLSTSQDWNPTTQSSVSSPASQPPNSATQKWDPATTQPVNPTPVAGVTSTTLSGAPTGTATQGQWAGGWNNGNALFAEKETLQGSNNTCRRRRRRRGLKSH